MTEAQGTQVIELLTDHVQRTEATGLLLASCLTWLQVVAWLLAALVFFAACRRTR